MSDNDVIEVKATQVNDIKVNERSIQELGDRIDLMKKFVSERLNNHIDGDYAVIPGTKKPSLLKPGAEKLLLLFGLGFRFEIINQVVDFMIGEVSFLIRCVVYRKATNEAVGEYIAFCSNQEKKYKNQNPADIVNTILKMSEKRALVGATISATGASDYFTQDLEDMDRTRTADSSKFKNSSGSSSGSFVIKFGKFKDQTLQSVGAAQIENYMNYMLTQAEEKGEDIKGPVKEFIDKAREFLREAA